MLQSSSNTLHSSNQDFRSIQVLSTFKLNLSLKFKCLNAPNKSWGVEQRHIILRRNKLIFWGYVGHEIGILWPNHYINMVIILWNYMILFFLPLMIFYWKLKQIQGNESKDTVTRPEVSEVDPQEKQKVTRSELSKLIKENINSSQYISSAKQSKGQKDWDMLNLCTYLDLVYKHPRRVS